MKIIVSAGGTGGHISPAISISKELLKRGHEVYYIGNENSMEQATVSKNNIPFFSINVQKLYRRITIKHILFPFKLCSSIIKVYKIFKHIKPDAYIGTGGFVSGPAGYVASLLKVPFFLQEQNSYPGITTRLLAAKSKYVFIGQQNAKNYLRNSTNLYLGNPINKKIISSTRTIDFDKFNIDKRKKTIFIIGGSQGSLFLNNIIDKNIDILLQNYNLIWQLGKTTFDKFYSKNKDRHSLIMFDFSYEIDKFYNIADLAICRSGALTIAELEAKKIPAILIPLPTSAENHQVKNALEQQDKNIAITLLQNKLDDNTFINQIDEIISNLSLYKSKFGECIHISSVDLIVDKIIETI